MGAGEERGEGDGCIVRGVFEKCICMYGRHKVYIVKEAIFRFLSLTSIKLAGGFPFSSSCAVGDVLV